MIYSFNQSDYRNLKGQIAEKLIRRYINEITIPSLRERWDDAIFTHIAWFGDEDLQNLNRPAYAQFWQKHEEKFFIARSLCPTPEFLARFKLLTKKLENIPDGFLVKLNKSSENVTLKQALNNLRIEGDWEDFGQVFFRAQHSDDEKLAVVNGEIEVIEIKSDKSHLMAHQKKSYSAILNEGFSLRFFHVDLSSFKENKFEIFEKLILNPKN